MNLTKLPICLLKLDIYALIRGEIKKQSIASPLDKAGEILAKVTNSQTLLIQSILP